MTEFDTWFTDAAEWLVDGKGESVVYTPLSGTARTITAIVTRRPRQRADENGKMYWPAIEIVCRNDGTTGIASSDTALVGGTIAVPLHLGKAATVITVRSPNPVEESDGLVTIALGGSR